MVRQVRTDVRRGFVECILAGGVSYFELLLSVPLMVKLQVLARWVGGKSYEVEFLGPLAEEDFAQAHKALETKVVRG